MRVGVVGSRGFTDGGLLFERLDIMAKRKGKIDLIVSGGAAGADSLAEVYAKERGIPTQIFKPDWTTYGKRAGPMRNKDIVAASDVIVAFWDGVSPGTRSTRDWTKKAGKPFVHVKFSR